MRHAKRQLRGALGQGTSLRFIVNKATSHANSRIIQSIYILYISIAEYW